MHKVDAYTHTHGDPRSALLGLLSEPKKVHTSRQNLSSSSTYYLCGKKRENWLSELKERWNKSVLYLCYPDIDDVLPCFLSGTMELRRELRFTMGLEVR